MKKYLIMDNFKVYAGAIIIILIVISAMMAVNLHYARISYYELLDKETLDKETWHTVATLTGVGFKRTDSFTIQGSTWKVTWTTTCEKEGDDRWLKGFIYHEGYSAQPIFTFDGVFGYKIMYQGTANYTMLVQAGLTTTWFITIEDYY